MTDENRYHSDSEKRRRFPSFGATKLSAIGPKFKGLNPFSQGKGDRIMKQRSFFKSLRGKLTWQVLIVGLLPIFIIGAVSFFTSGYTLDNAKTSLEESQQQLTKDVVGVKIADAAQTIITQIDQFMLARMNEVKVLASSPDIADTAQAGYLQAENMGLSTASIDFIEGMAPDPSSGRYNSLATDPATDAYLEKQASLSQSFGDLFLTDAHGYNISVTGPTPDFTQDDEQWWQTAWEKGSSVGEMEYNSSKGIWECDISVRVDDPYTDTPVGVMTARLDITTIQQMAMSNSHLVEGGEVSVFTSNGLLLAETISNHDVTRIANSEVMLSNREIMEAMDQVYASAYGKEYGLTEETVRGFARSAPADYYESIPGFDGLNWGVVVEQPKDVAFALLSGLSSLQDDLSNSQKTLGYAILAVALTMGLVGTAIAFSVSRSITGPISRLRDASEKVRLGNEDVEILVDSKDEIGDLAIAFDRMISERKLADEALRSERDYIKGIIECTPSAIVGIAPDGTVTFINPAGEEITGYSAQEITGHGAEKLIGQNWWKTFHPNEEYKQVERLFQTIEEDRAVRNYEMTLTDKSGGKHTCEWNASNQLDENGELIEVIAFGNDITERKQSEIELRKANDEINLILENVTSVSHAIVAGDFSKEIDITSEKPELGSALQEMIRILKGVVVQANTISAGDYEADIIPRSERDELGIALQNMTRALRDMKKENEKQLWFAERQAGLNNVMRGEQHIPDLSTGIAGYLAKTLNAQISTLYVMDDSENKLHLAGSYAFTRRKGNPAIFELGEGLVGQAALEKELISFNGIPEDYIKISSSLGDTFPRNILIIPFLYENKSKGVIELASIEEFSDEMIGFLTTSMEAVAIAIDSAQAREKLEELLDKSQEQAEQLQTQEEELRAANEELIHKTEKLEASERDLKSQREELQATNEELEEKTQKLQTSQQQLKSQQEKLQQANAELEEKTLSMEKQKGEVSEKNRDLETAQQELEQRADALRIASKYKSEFLANMSHELRTPLNSLLVLAQDMASNKPGNLNEDQMESADIIHKSGQDLLTLINEILDLSKIEAGKMPINIGPVLLPDIGNSINTNFKHLMRSKEVDLIINMNDNLPDTILTDQQRLLQIIKNLMSNAIKFTDKGSITVDFFRPDDETRLYQSGLNPQTSIAISVTDTGIGIPRDKQKPIFEAFQQADGSTSRQYGGTGLGLSISRELAKLLGGEIHLISEENVGSAFTIYLPAELIEVSEDIEAKTVARNPVVILTPAVHDEVPVSNQQYEIPSISDMEKRKAAPAIKDDRERIVEDDKAILVIEDDLNFAKTLYKFCHQRGFKCLHAGDGESGLQLAEQYQPTAIVLDIRLPGLDGWGVLEVLKDNPNTRHIPVHMMSAAEESLDAYKKGVIGYLTKPVDGRQLDDAFTKIETLISKTVKDLLIIENDAKLRKDIVELIGDGDVKTTTVGSGKQALQELMTNTYDCMILDLALSDISGFDVLREMNESEEISAPPVVVYAGRELTPDEELKLQMYSGSIMVKGVKSEERLLDETALFLHRVIDDLPENKKQIIARLHDKDSIFEGKKILLVDDDMRNVFALSKIMEGVGMEIYKASNGQKSLEVLDKYPEIDLILMDIMMPVMDGYEAMRYIREQERFLDLPILALTAKAMVDDREKCIAAGANDYMPKPVDIDRLLSLIRVWLYK